MSSPWEQRAGKPTANEKTEWEASGVTAYSFNSAGQLLSENGPWPYDTVNYGYQNRLRSAAAVEAPNASPWVVSYGYDSMKRLTNVTSPAGVFGYGYSGAGQSMPGGTLVDSIALPGGATIQNTFDSVGRLLSTVLKNPQLATLNSSIPMRTCTTQPPMPKISEVFYVF